MTQIEKTPFPAELSTRIYVFFLSFLVQSRWLLSRFLWKKDYCWRAALRVSADFLLIFFKKRLLLKPRLAKDILCKPPFRHAKSKVCKGHEYILRNTCFGDAKAKLSKGNPLQIAFLACESEGLQRTSFATLVLGMPKRSFATDILCKAHFFFLPRRGLAKHFLSNLWFLHPGIIENSAAKWLEFNKEIKEWFWFLRRNVTKSDDLLSFCMRLMLKLSGKIVRIRRQWSQQQPNYSKTFSELLRESLYNAWTNKLKMFPKSFQND